MGNGFQEVIDQDDFVDPVFVIFCFFLLLLLSDPLWIALAYEDQNRRHFLVGS